MERSAGPQILTNVRETRVHTLWHERTHAVAEPGPRAGFFRNLAAAMELWRRSRAYEVVIAAGNRSGSLFTLLAGLRPRSHPAVLMIDCLWYRPRNRMLLALKRLQFRLMDRAVRRYVVWASHEVRDYAEVFGIPREKLMFLPHHHTLEGYDFRVQDAGYLFSGGDGDRDYPTLLQAAAGLEMEVVIATRRKDWGNSPALPPGLRVFPATPEEFRQWMAGARLVVVPMRKGLLHSGGQQTYLNAMAMGKAVIVADDCGAGDYIRNGENGLIVPSEDPRALRRAMDAVLSDPDFAERLGRNAKKAYDEYSTAACLNRLLAIAEGLVS